MREEIAVAGYVYDAHKAVVICQHVFSGEAIVGFLHEHDGDLQAVCGSDDHDRDDDWCIVGLNHLIDHHPELRSLPDVAPGYAAERASPNDDWVVCAYAG